MLSAVQFVGKDLADEVLKEERKARKKEKKKEKKVKSHSEFLGMRFLLLRTPVFFSYIAKMTCIAWQLLHRRH